jgi:hypothetical protein
MGRPFIATALFILTYHARYFLLSFLMERGMLTSVNSEEYEEDALSI